MDCNLTVVGGGIGGLAAALALAKNGATLSVLEKAPEFAEVGAGLQLGPNASRMLDKLGVLESVHRHAVFPSRLKMFDIMDGKQITELDLGQGFRDRYGYPYLVMHRTDLHSALLEACRAQTGISLETNCDVLEVRDEGGQVSARCADGRWFQSEALIGADGLRSIVRDQLVGDGEPIDSHYVAYRGAVGMSAMSAHAGLDNVVLWTGHEFHLVQYPVRRGELYNQVAVFKTPSGVDDNDAKAISEELDKRFANACDHVKTAIPTVSRMKRWRLFDRNPIRGWTKGRVALLGDAAHPMLQYLAQGACQALEDAVCLAQQIQDHGGYEKAFAKYEDLRAPRTARIQRNARVFGDVIHADSVGIMLRDALLKDRAAEDVRYVDWMYGQDIFDRALVPIG
jgi:3-hydroxybenzoate 6-monooxygenase